MTQQQIQQRLSAYKTADLIEATGLNSSTISRHKHGGTMSAPVLAMWRFFFQLEETRKEKKTLIEVLGIKAY